MYIKTIDYFKYVYKAGTCLHVSIKDVVYV